ncbi:hypothetical protein ACOMHN_042917 [Nucella lapillus]
MRNLVQKNNMTVNGTYPFDSNLEKTIEQLKAFKKGFYGKSIVWIFPGFYDLKWYDHDDFNCSARDKLKVINGYFTVSNVNMAAPDEGQPIGATQKEYLDRFKCKALHSETCSGQNLSDVVEPGQIRAPLSYDAMWAIALALNATLTEMVDQGELGRPPSALNEFSYHNYEMGQMIFRHMQNTSFRGISGKINFTPTGDRIPQIEIKQFQVTDLDAAPNFELVNRLRELRLGVGLPRKRGCRGGRKKLRSIQVVPSRNLHPLMVPPFLQPHPDLQSAVGNAPLSSKHPTQLPTTDCLLSIIPLMGGQPSDAPALSPPSPLQQGGQSNNAPALSPPSPLPQGGQPIALALSPSSPPPQNGQPSDAPGLLPSSSTLLLCPSDSTLSICHLNSQSAVKTGGNPPYSSRRTERVLKPLSRQLYVAMCLLASVGVLVSVAFLAFNIRNRNVRLIKMSSPKINNLILVGCMLVYCTVSVSDILTQGLDVLCHVRLYLLVMGFSLGFGALFAKTWRVYEIMTAAAGSRRLNTRALLDSRLYLIVLGLVAVNLCLLVVWTIMDAMVMTAIDIEDAEVHRDDDVLEIPQSLECHSRYKLQFTIGLMALQALLILFGAFLAVQTRKVTIPELNDSRWVGLCIYNVVVLGSLGAILILGTRQPPDVTYLLESLIVLVGTTLTQCLVFVPKLLAFRRSKRGRQGSQYMVTVKTLSISVPSNSPISKDPKSPADPKLSSSCSRSSPGSSPSKTLRKASRSLSTVLKKCCSPDKEAGIAGGWQNNGYEGDGQDGSRPVKQMVSRGVSTCNLLDLSWLLRSVEAASGLDLACQHILREKYAHCGRRLECVYHQMWFKNTKANLLRPQLMNGVCSPVKGRLPPSDLIQKGGCPLSCHPVPVCCCSLLKPLAIKGGHSLRRCLSISTPEQMLANSSAAEHIFDRRDHDASTDLSLLAGRFVPEPAAPPPTDTNPQPICPPPKYVEGRPQGDISALGDPPTLMIQHSRLSPLLPTAGLLFVSGGRSPDDLAVLRAMGTLSSSVTVQGLQADAPCPPLVFHTNVDPALTATCPSLIRSASSSQLPPLW